ncbi:MAG: hypothetical protein ACLFNU_03740 [Bacteroidales bacterium]
MIKIISIGFAILLSLSAFSQTERTKVNVSSGDTLNYALSMGMQYVYPAFVEGTVYFDNRDRSKSLLNYNILVDEIHFINADDLDYDKIRSEKDFLRIARKLNLKGVDFVVIGQDVFFNTRDGIMRLVANYDVKLLQKNKVVQKNQAKQGAYGQPIQTASIEQKTSFNDSRSGQVRLSTESENEYSRLIKYYLYQDGKITPATKRRFERTFRGLKSEIREFVEAEEIDFKNQADLKKLLKFCIDNS